jgi:anti-anti-sigma regulatory factor
MAQRRTRVGRFTHDASTNTWTWSDGFRRLFGVPAEAKPTTGLLAARLPAGDRDRVLGLLDAALADGGPVAEVHGALGEGDSALTVLTVVQRDPAAASSVTGYTADVTDRLDESAAWIAHREIDAAIRSRSVVDQAKGILMLVHGLDDATAFALLRWLSQHTNTKLRTLAERITGVAAGIVLPRPIVRFLDAVLSDAALGVPSATPRGLDEDLHVDVVAEPTTVTLRVRGPITLTTAPSFADALAELASGAHAERSLVVDLSQVGHLASVGVAELHRLRRRTARRDQDVSIVPPAQHDDPEDDPAAP